jgi:SAM-dependent methyltransferase
MSLAYRVSAYNRNRKWKLFCRHFPPEPENSILDVGFSDQEYSSTDNYLEKHYPYPGQITALGIDEPREFGGRYPQVRAVHYDGSDFPFGDKSFDIVWSNAVLEHVGEREEQLKFLKEIKRTAKHGFITTPNRHFPVEIHTRLPFVHWLPKSWFDRILRFLGKDWAGGSYMHLLSRKELENLLKQADFGSYKLYHNRLGGIALDFVVVF